MDEVEWYGVSGGPGGAEGIDLGDAEDSEDFEPTPYMLDWWPTFT